MREAPTDTLARTVWQKQFLPLPLKPLVKALFYFGASTLITWLFIVKGSGLYENSSLMLASCAIAGGKWGLQVVAALLWLREKRWDFISHIGGVCFAGSMLLVPYCLSASLRQWPYSFLGSLVGAVLLMIVLYYGAVRRSGISFAWFWAWIACLLIAISLQLFAVFSLAG